MKGLGALQRHQLPHPPCRNPGSATEISAVFMPQNGRENARGVTLLGCHDNGLQILAARLLVVDGLSSRAGLSPVSRAEPL